MKGRKMKMYFNGQQMRALVSTGIAASVDDVIPVLQTISVAFNAETNEITAIATDRYRVARNRFTVSEGDVFDGVSFTVLLPVKPVTAFWNSVKTAALRGNLPVVFSVDLESDTVTGFSFESGGQTFNGVPVSGNYPNIERLIPSSSDVDSFKPASVFGLNPRFIGDLAKLFCADDLPRENLKNTPWNFHSQMFGDSAKPGPVYITRPGGVEYLIQPVMRLR